MVGTRRMNNHPHSPPSFALLTEHITAETYPEAKGHRTSVKLPRKSTDAAQRNLEWDKKDAEGLRDKWKGLDQGPQLASCSPASLRPGNLVMPGIR
jgi:hypothetical protein